MNKKEIYEYTGTYESYYDLIDLFFKNGYDIQASYYFGGEKIKKTFIIFIRKFLPYFLNIYPGETINFDNKE